MDLKREVLCLTVISCVALLLACSDRKPDDEQTENKTIQGVYDTLRIMDLPLKIGWREWDREIESHMQKYGPIGGSDLLENPVARVSGMPGYNAVIFLSPDETASPAFVTIGRDDNPIDTLYLLGDNSSNDPNWLTVEYSEIGSDQTIVLLDSVFHWDLDAKGERIPRSGTVSVDRKKFKVLESGKIEEIGFN